MTSTSPISTMTLVDLFYKYSLWFALLASVLIIVGLVFINSVGWVPLLCGLVIGGALIRKHANGVTAVVEDDTAVVEDDTAVVEDDGARGLNNYEHNMIAHMQGLRRQQRLRARIETRNNQKKRHGVYDI